MKLRSVLLSSVLTVLGVWSANGQSLALKAKIPFEFTVGGKVLPAGQYEFTTEKNSAVVRVKNPVKNTAVVVPVITRLAGEEHTTPQDSHFVFDTVGNTRILSEIWPVSGDGFMLAATKTRHQHSVVNVPK